MANNNDSFRIEILDDGTLKVTTDKVSAANHVNADRFIREMFKAAGGEVEIQHRHGKKIHHHSAASITQLEAGGANHTH
jgi:hypothetical protein